MKEVADIGNPDVGLGFQARGFGGVARKGVCFDLFAGGAQDDSILFCAVV